MIRPVLIAGAAALAALVGCAAQEQAATGGDAYKAPVYRTGSNLPAGRETGEAAPELSASERKSVEDLQNRPRQPTIKMN